MTSLINKHNNFLMHKLHSGDRGRQDRSTELKIIKKKIEQWKLKRVAFPVKCGGQCIFLCKDSSENLYFVYKEVTNGIALIVSGTTRFSN